MLVGTLWLQIREIEGVREVHTDHAHPERKLEGQGAHQRQCYLRGKRQRMTNSGKQLLVEDSEAERGFGCAGEDVRGSPRGPIYSDRGSPYEEIQHKIFGGH